jgi:hypothetical protein
MNRSMARKVTIRCFGVGKPLDPSSVPQLSPFMIMKSRLCEASAFATWAARNWFNPDTVFQLASLSKPIAPTVVAALVGSGKGST